MVLLLLSAGTWRRTQAGSFNVAVCEGTGSCAGARSPNYCADEAAVSAAVSSLESKQVYGSHDVNNTEKEGGDVTVCSLESPGSKQKSAELATRLNDDL